MKQRLWSHPGDQAVYIDGQHLETMLEFGTPDVEYVRELREDGDAEAVADWEVREEAGCLKWMVDGEYQLLLFESEETKAAVWLYP